jgi:transposase
MRKSYGGLYALIRDRSPLSGDYFLFMGKDRKKAKVLFWDGTGLNIWQKRMEKGTFADIFLRPEMTSSELQLFMEGSLQVKQRIAAKDLTQKFAA